LLIIPNTFYPFPKYKYGFKYMYLKMDNMSSLFLNTRTYGLFLNTRTYGLFLNTCIQENMYLEIENMSLKRERIQKIDAFWIQIRVFVN
jgi:hypothetical protein